MVIRGEGFVGASGIWILFITIPEAVFAEGVGEYPWYVEDTGDFNFSVELYSGTLDAGNMLEEVWIESITDNAVLVIDEVCEPCTSVDAADCDLCEFSLQSLFFAMRTKLAL